MNQQIKEIRTYQIAALALMKCLPGCRIEQVRSEYYDFLVTYDTSLTFGIEIKNSRFLRTKHYETYINSLQYINVTEENNRIPILIASVNEEDETVMIGFLLSWQFNKIKIYKKPSMIELNQKNANKILDFVKSMDNTIRILSEYGMKVVKKINIEYQNNNGYISIGTLVYLRDFTKEYKMQQKEIITEREKFDRILTGIPQSEYPEDDLDKTIFEVIQQRFPNSKKSSDLMLFSTELRELQELSHSHCKSIEFIILPELERQHYVIPNLLNVIKAVRFNIDVFTESTRDADFFDGLHLETTKSMDGWDETYQAFLKALTTKSSPKDYFI